MVRNFVRKHDILRVYLPLSDYIKLKFIIFCVLVLKYLNFKCYNIYD